MSADFKLSSDYEPRGDQPEAIAQLVRRHQRRRPAPGAAGRHRLGQNVHDGQSDRAAQPSRDRAGAQQDAGRAALPRVQIVLPAERRRIFRQLLRLLPARSLCPVERHLHRERIHDQRRARQAAHERHALALRAARRDHRRLRLLHLRHRLAGSVLRHDADARKRAVDRARSDPAQAGGDSVRARRRFAPRHFSRARRHRSRFIRRTKITPFASKCGAARSKPFATSIRSPAKFAAATAISRACRFIPKRTTCCPPEQKERAIQTIYEELDWWKAELEQQGKIVEAQRVRAAHACSISR